MISLDNHKGVLLGLCAPMMIRNSMKEVCFGDFTNINKDSIKQMLARDWEVSCHKTYLDTKEFFLKRYKEEIIPGKPEVDYFFTLEESLYHQEHEEIMHPQIFVNTVALNDENFYSRFGSSYLRHSFVVVCSYMTGIIKEDEMWDDLEIIYNEFCKFFGNWKEYAQGIIFALKINRDITAKSKDLPIMQELLMSPNSPWKKYQLS